MKKDRNPILSKVQVNIPFTMLVDSYFQLFLDYHINPEIGIDADALDTFSNAEFQDVAEEFAGHGLAVTIHGPFIDLSPGSPDPEIRGVTRHRLQQLLALIPFFNPRSVVCHAGFETRRYGYLKEKWFYESIETWKWLGHQTKILGTSLMLENVYEDRPDQMQIIFEALRPYGVGFCFDTGHQLVFSQSTIDEWIGSLGAYLGQLHLHDNQGHEDVHLAPGMGKVDFPKLFQRLKALDIPRPIITLEPHEEKYLWPGLDFLEKHWVWEGL